MKTKSYEAFKKIRKSWNINPRTKVKESKKIYKRNKKINIEEEL